MSERRGGGSASSLRREFEKLRPRIESYLQMFRALREADDARWFEELCFCLLAVQANAHHADEAVRSLKAAGLLAAGTARDIRPHLRKVRFLNTKARWIVAARGFVADGGAKEIRARLRAMDSKPVRDWLADEVDGIGLKEASHLLRNLGFGDDLAILDRHILRSLVRLRVISRLPSSLSRARYLGIEEKMRTFARSLGMTLAQADAILWWRETGELFK